MRLFAVELMEPEGTYHQWTTSSLTGGQALVPLKNVFTSRAVSTWMWLVVHFCFFQTLGPPPARGYFIRGTPLPILAIWHSMRRSCVSPQPVPFCFNWFLIHRKTTGWPGTKNVTTHLNGVCRLIGPQVFGWPPPPATGHKSALFSTKQKILIVDSHYWMKHGHHLPL